MAKRLDEIRRRLEPLRRRVFHAYFLLVRAMTLGVRAVVLDADNKVFLVKHSYVSGWYLPGGGVDYGETMEQAMRRELKEEGDIDLTGEAVLHGIFLNSHISRRDHVAVYVVRHFRQDRLPAPNHEIIECGFFDTAALPEETTRGTRLRIAEVLHGKPLIATWR
ncbi:NUDIX domain-containing protein [Bradyrhizobium sp. LB11.1]|jgi:8-oxo-dGTP pyrophosphatase MutT (NUDIX family)|uniref:NUDIX domain-containing protein n=1 Tax=Bradyrhizobium sp. LB11.1 TaxID=3156326 RepID=UPI003399BD8F